jgi:leader peptidase (prepilin peptidase)/N-methyltransferase
MMPCIFFGLIGLLLGSFLNVCILRLPAGESVVTPRSRCPQCKQPIAGWDNIPVLSWIFLRAKCRACGERISWRYPAVELATSALFLLCCFCFSFSWHAAGWALLCFLLLGLVVMDAETLLLPDAFTYPGLVAGIAVAALRGGLRGAGLSALAAAIAAATLLLIAGAYYLARRQMGMGMGDVKLLAMLAAWLGLPQTALVLFLSVVVGAIYGLGTILVNRKKNSGPLGQMPVPFGTMLSLAGLYSVFLGDGTLRWYLGFFR